MMDTYGSHVLRLILSILAGSAVSQMENKQNPSNKKSDFMRSKSSHKYNEEAKLEMDYRWMSKERKVPASFTEKLKEVVQSLVENLSELQMRALSMHPSANPVLQALLFLNREDIETADSLINKILMNVASTRPGE